MCAPHASQVLHAGHLRALRLCAGIQQAGRSLSDDALDLAWQSIDAIKAAAETPLRREAARMLEEQGRQAAARLPEALAAYAAKDRDSAPGPDLVARSIIDIRAWLESVRSRLSPLFFAALEEGFRTGYLSMDATVPAFNPSASAEQVIVEVVRRADGMTDYTIERLSSVIDEGLRREWTVDEIAAAIRAQFTDWASWRAEALAQTAVTAAFEAGQQQAFDEAEIESHRWLTQRDGDVRASHSAIDGDVVKRGEVFANGLRWPGDPLGAADEVIRCRCTVLPVLPEGGPSKTLVTPEGDVIDTREMNERELGRVLQSLRDFNIRMAHRMGEKSLPALAERFSVSESTARRAIWGRYPSE